tara:strand:+ start:1681 stop:2328 length:648 start_codon:yes stop_codon:yes gene_type:complete
MRLNLKYFIISFTSLLILILIFFYVYIGLNKNKTNLIKFNGEDLSTNFELNIYKNINNINLFLNNHNFIDSYLIKKNNSITNVDITLKKPFAKNSLNQEIIFIDSSIASYDFFDQSFIDSIDLIDTSQESLQINNYLQSSFEDLKENFNIIQIEFIDKRRYDLILDNNIKVMLPKKIDKKLITFIEKNINSLKNSTEFKEYLDFRNFNEKTIRVK